MTSVLIRACTHHDIDDILQLDRLWHQENIAYDFTFISREVFINELERDPPYFLVAEIDGCIVGYMNASVHASTGLPVISEGETYLEIDNVYVQPAFRNRDVGGKLIDEMCNLAKQRGIQRFLVSSDSKDMDRVLNFYRRHGFTPSYVQLFK